MIGNAIGTFFQRKKGKGVGPLPPIPGLEGVIGLYIAKGLTNDSMKENLVWKDLSGNGNDLQMKNFSWELDSGVGIYKENFTNNNWIKSADRADITATNSSILISSIKSTIIQFFKYRSASSVVPSMTVKISGLPDGMSFNYRTSKTIMLTISSDGVYTLPNYTMEEGDHYYGFKFLKTVDSCNITIEQIPDYEGAICFDGVDDYGICDNFPILTKDKGYTVMALRKWLTPDSKMNNEIFISNLRNLNWDTANFGAFICEVKYNNNTPKAAKTISFGKESNINLNENNPLFYQTINSYNEDKIGIGDKEWGKFLFVGCGGNLFFANVAIYSICIIDHNTIEEERELVINKWKQDYPELFFDQAWTVTGKTNDDEDRATVKNLTGNGNDLVLSNFGFAEGSGYNEEGEYAGYLVTDGVDDTVISKFFDLGKDFTVIGEWKFLDNIKVGGGIVKAYSLFVYNLNNGLRIRINGRGEYPELNTKGLKAICSDGRVYSDDWSETLIDVEQTVTSSEGAMLIAHNGSSFAKIAIKNLAFYDRVLSKRDCIEAYNYLQTFKNS